jgi:hypothetical protein
MPNDLAVRSVSAAASVVEMSGSTDATPEAIPPRPPRGDTGRPNPSLRLDGALGMVIIEFHAESGAVTTSIPTERQLQAYRVWERTGTNGAAPPGQSSNAAADLAPVVDPHPALAKRA